MPLPESFDNVDSFLRYCRSHSKKPKALFKGVHVNYLCELMGLEPVYSDKELKNNSLYAINSEEMDYNLRIVENQRNSIEGVCKEISGSVVRLDDYR